MPLYDYRCENCSHQLEVLQSASEGHQSDCPECKQPQLKRLVSAPSFTFKGGGWYKDLYGSSKAASSESKSASTTAAKDSSTASASDTSTTTGKKTSDKAAS